MNDAALLEVTHPPRYLRAPVQQHLGADVLAILAHVVEETAERHELCDEHHLRGHAHGQDAHAARVLHRRHDARLLQQLFVQIG